MQSAVATAIESIRRTILDESPYGGVAVRDIRTLEEPGPDDETYVHFVVSARDPDPEPGTWPHDDVFRLRLRVLELANQSDVDLPRVVVDVYPEHEDEEASALDEAAS
jgi:hypothetical protein